MKFIVLGIIMGFGWGMLEIGSKLYLNIHKSTAIRIVGFIQSAIGVCLIAIVMAAIFS